MKDNQSFGKPQDFEDVVWSPSRPDTWTMVKVADGPWICTECRREVTKHKFDCTRSIYK